ncbi:TIGR04197 family type VII secretion effector [Enterococcus caccae]|nr:TIGR04197 family type VII secretion effector [Enterococcus caccae]
MVGSVSARFSQVASEFLSVNEAVHKAERTTVSGNSNAKNSLTSIYSCGQRVSKIIARDNHTIHSLTKESSKMDQKIRKDDDFAPFSLKFGGDKHK